MHIPDAVLDAPVALATGAVAAAGFAVGLRRLEGRLGERTTVLMGTMAAFVFAAQMVNFPVGWGASGHLLGGTLAAVLLGPWAGAIVIGAVLLVQALLFGDGGLTALGANFVNMGLVGAVGGYAIYAPIRRAIGGPTGVLIGGMVAAWFSVLLASGAFAIELAASGRSADFFRILGAMALVHAVIGVGEAVITGLVLRSLLLTRPDLFEEPDAPAPGRLASTGRVAVAGLAVALAIGAFLSPLASDLPDGLEHVLGGLGLLPESAPAWTSAPIPEYQLPILGVSTPTALAVATAMAGVVGTVVVFGVGLGLARAFARRGADGMGADAA